MKKKLRAAFAASGSGTCFQSVLDNIDKGILDVEPVLFITDKPDCRAVERAREREIPVLDVAVPKLRRYLPKEEYNRDERALAARVIHEHRLLHGTEDQPGLLEINPAALVTLGFMRVLTDYLLSQISRQGTRTFNTHPAPVPEYRGIHGYAWGAGDDKESIRKNRWHCMTFHEIINAEFDTGPIISQSPLEVLADDTTDTLKERGLQQEYEQIRECLQWLAEGRLVTTPEGFEVLDESGSSYRDRIGLKSLLHEGPMPGRYEIRIKTKRSNGRAPSEGNLDIHVDCTHPEKESYHRQITHFHELPFNIAFTDAYRQVKGLRAQGCEVELYFDNMYIHPVSMKSDLEADVIKRREEKQPEKRDEVRQ
ncbi:phosphoribosylglycinamide formyltransferase [Nanoarchaeota archaeon]